MPNATPTGHRPGPAREQAAVPGSSRSVTNDPRSTTRVLPRPLDPGAPRGHRTVPSGTLGPVTDEAAPPTVTGDPRGGASTAPRRSPERNRS
ncbi:hypothetical protein BJ968_002093 [Kineococcus aurantiacus]|uniref:Uncharacterized protein n=1 Tax=Kineococcus aurantiacus TaxID=37633 RepID=A0A7Y9J0X4_9ACTN|nr:hypothetical protein [Kineococcus aurantiacus]